MIAGRMLRAALRYAALGWPVFPLLPRGKIPLIARAHGGGGFHDATTDEGQARDWWTCWPGANIGIATGHAFDVLDVDPAHSGGGTLHALCAQHGPLPATREAITGSGGRHVFFLPDARVRCSAGRLGPGLDVRGSGGYVVVPPSVHPGGRRYRWSVRGVELAPWPEWMLDLILQPPAAPRPRVPVRLRDDGRGSYYGLAALRNACERIAGACVGTRHGILVREAAGVAELYAGGEVDAPLARGCLLDAAQACGLPECEAVPAIGWAFAAGERNPRRAPGRASW